MSEPSVITAQTTLIAAQEMAQSSDPSGAA